MANTQTSDHDEPATGAFPIPFTTEQLHADVQTMLLLMARQLNFVFGRPTTGTIPEQTSLLGLPASSDINDPGMSAAALGLRYDMVQSTSLAEVMESLYQYAFLGIDDIAREPMTSDSAFTWVSVIVNDLVNSAFVAEWQAYGPSEAVDAAAARCLLVCETAQARRILEGHDDNFMDWADSLESGLTFRQMALLSGMTEASVRTLSNPKRRNPLVTVNDGKNVRIEVAAGKAWLQAKGRYVPIRRTNRAGQFDLAARRFSGTDELMWALDQRLQFLWAQGEADVLRRRCAEQIPGLLDDQAEQPSLRLTRTQLGDSRLMTAVADLLGLPGELLPLRASEACAREALAEIEQRIQRTLKSEADHR